MKIQAANELSCFPRTIKKEKGYEGGNWNKWRQREKDSVNLKIFPEFNGRSIMYQEPFCTNFHQTL